MRQFIILLVCASTVVAQDSRGNVSRLLATEVGAKGQPEVALPVGKWKVEFANGVTEVCQIGNGGERSSRSRGEARTATRRSKADRS